MALLGFLIHPIGPQWGEGLLDSSLLILFLAPLLWCLIARPLRRDATVEQAKTAAIVGAATDGVIAADERGRIELFNPAAESIFGYCAAEVLGREATMLVPDETRLQFAEAGQEFLATGESPFIGRTTELLALTSSGRRVPVAFSLTAVRVNRRWKFTGLVRDLTASKHAETKRQSRALQQAAVVRQGQRALACDDLGLLLKEMAECVSQALEVNSCLILELLPDGETLLPRGGYGWSPALLEKTSWNVTRDSSSVGSLLAELPVAVENFCVEAGYDGPDLLLYHGITSGLTVLIPHGERPFGVLGVYSKSPRVFDEDEVHFLDEIAFVITLAVQRKEAEIRRHEQETMRAEHLATVAQMATGVAHELRNPLTAVKMLVQTAQEGSAGLQAEDLGYVVDEIRRMERSLQCYLGFARPQKPERRESDLVELIRRTLSLIHPRAVQQQVTLEFAPPGTSVVADIDPEQIQQVLINLTFNALDMMPRGGTLKIEFAPPLNGNISLRVLDNGPGIAPQVLGRLFRPFFTSKETGTGLGLVVSRRIAEEHGGTLTAENRPEGGACFELRIPETGPSPA